MSAAKRLACETAAMEAVLEISPKMATEVV
jgi:hypothetical protein